MKNTEPKHALLVSKKDGTPDQYWCGAGCHWSHDLADAKMIDKDTPKSVLAAAKKHAKENGRELSIEPVTEGEQKMSVKVVDAESPQEQIEQEKKKKQELDSADKKTESEEEKPKS